MTFVLLQYEVVFLKVVHILCYKQYNKRVLNPSIFMTTAILSLLALLYYTLHCNIDQNSFKQIDLFNDI